MVGPETTGTNPSVDYDLVFDEIAEAMGVGANALADEFWVGHEPSQTDDDDAVMLTDEERAAADLPDESAAS